MLLFHADPGLRIPSPGRGMVPYPAAMVEALDRAADEALAHAPPLAMPGIGPDLRLAMAAELCPYGSGACGCGAGPPRHCGHPGRPLEVRRADCLRCLPALDWEAGVEAVG